MLSSSCSGGGWLMRPTPSGCLKSRGACVTALSPGCPGRRGVESYDRAFLALPAENPGGELSGNRNTPCHSLCAPGIPIRQHEHRDMECSFRPQQLKVNALDKGPVHLHVHMEGAHSCEFVSAGAVTATPPSPC